MNNVWSVQQACVWGATRDDLALRAVRPDHALGKLDDESPISNHIMDWRKKNMEASGLGKLPSILEASEQLLDRCQRGKIVMYGRKRGKGELQQIPQDVLLNAVIVDRARSGGPIIEPPDIHDNRTPWWADLKVDCLSIQNMWPAIPDSPITTAAAASSVPPRPKGTFGDSALVERAMTLFDGGGFRSRTAAADTFAEEIPGGGSPLSKAKRIGRKADQLAKYKKSS